jgi:hypothetical protein
MLVDELATALRRRDALRARTLYAELMEVDSSAIAKPILTDPIDLAIAASIVELVAARRGTAAPAWTREVGALAEPFLLVTVRLPEKVERLRRESPPELRARNLLAPESFLLSA